MDERTDEKRRQAYLDLLNCGLIAIRNFASASDVNRCLIEAEHLHGIPSLVGEPNEARHTYYIVHTRSLYLEQLRNWLGAEPNGFPLSGFAEPWRTLGMISGVQLDV